MDGFTIAFQNVTGRNLRSKLISLQLQNTTIEVPPSHRWSGYYWSNSTISFATMMQEGYLAVWLTGAISSTTTRVRNADI